jgi:hypothetical protein
LEKIQEIEKNMEKKNKEFEIEMMEMKKEEKRNEIENELKINIIKFILKIPKMKVNVMGTEDKNFIFGNCTNLEWTMEYNKDNLFQTKVFVDRGIIDDVRENNKNPFKVINYLFIKKKNKKKKR